MELKAYRARLDALDAQLVELLKARMALSAEIGAYKKQKGLPVYDAAREAALLFAVRERAGADAGAYIAAVYEAILAASRDCQTRIIHKGVDKRAEEQRCAAD